MLYIGKFGRRKTAPSFEKAPSHDRPIFSGRQDIKSSASSSIKSLLEPNDQNKTKRLHTPETPPVRMNMLILSFHFSF